MSAIIQNIEHRAPFPEDMISRAESADAEFCPQVQNATAERRGSHASSLRNRFAPRRVSLNHQAKSLVRQKLERHQTKVLHESQESLAILDNVHNERSQTHLERWCAVYCGGSKPVLEIIQKIGQESGIYTAVESFDW